MKKIVIISSSTKSLKNFRGHLIDFFLKEKKMAVVALAPKDKYFESIKNWIELMGGRLEPITINNTALNPFSDILSFWSIFRELSKLKPDYVLSYGIKPVIYGSCAARLLGVQRINSLITGLGNCFMEENKKSFLRKIVNFLYKTALSFNTKVIFQNQDDLDLFVEEEIVRSDKTAVVNGSGVDTEYFFYKTPSVNPLCFLFVGRLIKQKGIMEFWQAAQEVKKFYPETTFTVVGGRYPSSSNLSDQEFKALQNDPDIDYLGEVEDVRNILHQSSVFVLPSYREGISRACLEAMSCGLPVITTDAPGCRQTVEDGVNGFLVPVKSVGGLKKAMMLFVQKQDLIKRMGLKSCDIVEQKFCIKSVTENTIRKIVG